MRIKQTILPICDHSNLYFFSFDNLSSTFSYTNQAFKEHFKDLIDQQYSVLDYIHPDDKELVLSNYKDCIAGNKIFDLESRLIMKENINWYKISVVLSTNDAGEPTFSGHAENITLAKEQLHILHRHNEKKNAILNILSHDLMAPIGMIEALSNLLQRANPGQAITRPEQYIAMIHKISKKCINLIRNFIAVEFMESASIEIKKTRVNLVTTLKVLLDEYKKNEKDIGKQFFISSSADNIFVEIDEDKFLQVINNLISNSLKFTGDNGNITITVEDEDKTVLIKVSDDGVGIPKKFHSTLFDKFTPARRKGLRGEESNGLGMSIIKAIVEWHKGKIWFESEENNGTTFFIQLPVK